MKAALLATSISICLAVATMGQSQTELYGYVRYSNNSPASAVAVSINGYSVATDGNGYYKIGFLKPGTATVLVSPRGKPTRSFKVMIGAAPTQRDFVIDW
jgi:hypothetical protein